MRAAYDSAATPPDITVSQWADRYRMLSQEGSAEPGRWDTSRAEYQREWMDVFTDPTVETIVLMVASQLGKSEVLLNLIGYCIHFDPGPMMMVQPDKENAEEFAQDRLDNMLRDTPDLSDRVFASRGASDDKKKSKRGLDKHSGKMIKRFRGGYLSIASANVPASLASKPVRRLFGDEIDRYKASAGKEGDPVELAKKRTTTFYDRKHCFSSTPLNKGQSRIESLFETSDKREYFVPCPHCDEYQTLKWANLFWDKEIVDGQEVHKPETAYMVCEHCGSLLFETDKFLIISGGQWIAQGEFRGVAGFRMSALYSPWFTWAEMVREFLDAQGKPDQLKTFINTRLGEPWAQEGETVESESIYHRREKYPAEVPDGAFVLTAGVDVQKDRLEALVYGWGLGEEAWGIDHAVFWGNTEQAGVWLELQNYLDRDFGHESGVRLRLSSTCIDSGFLTQIVYDFCRGKTAQRIFATKGMDGEGRPVVTAPAQKRTGKNERPVELFTVGTDTTKEIFYLRLQRTEPGPGYIHYPDRFNEEFFKQLTAEKLIKKYERGFPKKVWVKTRARNEALDMSVLCYAALKMLSPNWESWRDRVVARKVETQQTPAPPPARRRIIGRMF